MALGAIFLKMKAEVLNIKGEVVKEVELPEEIFNLEFNADLVHQVLVSQIANKRKNIAHTKTRSEVRGGGRKPWPQKGLGRARHGSIRSPIFRKGGVVFGPRKERVYKKKIPKKIKRKALFSVLSQKLREREIIFVEDFELEKPKTKEMKKILENLKIKGSCLIALPKVEKNIVLSARNLPKVSTIECRNLNCLEVLNHKYLVMFESCIKEMEKTFLKK